MAKFRILCIEDNPDTQRMLTFVLARAGYDVITADDGPQGIQKARAWRPALILVDMMMPQMSGAETIKKLREIDIIKDIPFVQSLGKDVSIVVQQHHERLNGTGYPNGLSDVEIELESKILSVADVMEAMSSHRPYRPALNIDVAMNEIRKNRGVFYSPKCVDACLELFAQHDNNSDANDAQDRIGLARCLRTFPEEPPLRDLTI